MPRFVRNGWVEVVADGIHTQYATGPRTAMGGLQATFYTRHENSVMRAFAVTQRVLLDEQERVQWDIELGRDFLANPYTTYNIEYDNPWKQQRNQFVRMRLTSLRNENTFEEMRVRNFAAPSESEG